MSNEIYRPAGAYTGTDPFAEKPVLPPFPNITDVNTKVAAQLISEYLAGVADTSIRTTYTTADTLATASERGAIVGGNIMIDVMGDNPVVRDFGLIGIEPPINPDTIDVDFDATLDKIKQFTNDLQTSWLMRYFPAALPNGLDPLLQMITNGTIVSEAMQEIFWERAKRQAVREARRAESEAINNWAARGFDLPGGAVNARLNRINQDLQFAVSDIAAQQAIKALDIQVDAVKFAAEIGTQLQLGLANAFTGLVAAYIRLPSAATDYAVGISNARRATFNVMNDYYRLLIDNGNLRMQADQTNAELHQRYLATSAQFMASHMSSQVSAAANATDSYARIAAQTLGGVSSVTQIGIESITSS